jgi:2-desacetyl-2-hydroxyethyl bacteriochlorophyllide A dehydrogenase
VAEPNALIDDQVGAETMTAARFYEPGQPLRIEHLPVPRPAVDEVLVRVHATGLCGSDVHIAVEGITATPYRPIVLGHEISGVVAAMGDGPNGWRVGDRVAVNGVVADGTCAQCVAGRSQLCASRSITGIHREGGLAEYVAVPARNLVALPASVPFDIGAIVTDAVSTPFHALVDVARVQPGEAVAVFGAGGLGLHAVQIAKLMGAHPIVAVDVRAVQCDRAAAHGADVVVDASREPAAEAVLAATGGAGVAVAAEFVGEADSIAQAVASLAIGGRAVIAGLGAEPIAVQPPTVFVRRELQILSSYGFTISTVRRVLALVEAGLLNLEDSITHTFPLDEADRALRTLHEKLGDPQRVVVVP